jgi:PPOX class probable FMN-dependent enzyme
MIVDSLAALEAIYSAPLAPASTVKVAALIAAAPFAVLATSGPDGLDCSPRGDRPGFVRVADPRTLILPDRRGNNRIDSLRNIVRDPRVALLFLIPGSGTTLRVNGQAVISADPDLLASFSVDGHAPRTAIVITVAEIYFQCARAIIRARLWDPESRIDPKRLPSPGAILAALTAGEVGGQRYDAEWPERAAKTMW